MFTGKPTRTNRICKSIDTALRLPRRALQLLEPMEPRRLFAIAAAFTPATGLLAVSGDGLDNAITVSRNPAGNLLVNGGAVTITGGTPTVANTAQIQISAGGGNDLITLDESNGALPAAQLHGEEGNDTITGGSGADSITGGTGNDVLFGRGGNDSLFGNADNDTLTGGSGDDQLFGQSGDDRMVWNPGDAADLLEGADGTDTAEINGGSGAESFTITANGTRVRFDRLDPPPFFLDIGTTENLVLNANGGNDSLACTGNLAALISITADGGAGNDTLLGSNGIDALIGGADNDSIDGQQGNDIVFLGTGDDVFQWDPGDGSDLVEGQDGNDTLVFNGSATSELFELLPNGQRTRLTRNIASIVMDLAGIEKINLNALGGADTITVNDMTGTALTEVNVNLASSIGGNIGDSAADVVVVNATAGNDIITVSGAGTAAGVVGLQTEVSILNSEAANDSLIVNALAGDDGLSATALPAGIIKLTLDGGANNDVLLGSQGADTLLGGDGADFILGDNGNDLALMGGGDDVFQWEPGDGNDIIEGQAGADRLLFFGANVAENISISANGGRVIFFRDIASVTMDIDDVEQIDFRALGGADNIIVGDLAGTDVTSVAIDLRGAGGGGDAANDTITVNGTNGGDALGAAGSSGTVNVFGLQAAVSISFAEASNDRLVLNGQGGDDTIDASGIPAGVISTSLSGGLGNDVLFGSQGADSITGGDGNDLAFMGGGDDTFTWNPGDDNDTIEGQAGTDTLIFNGANVAENISISRNGGRVRFFRDIANVVVDLDDTEVITFNALGGADTITVNGTAGTDLAQVNIDLLAAGGQGDAAIDNIVINGNSTADTMNITADATSGVNITGMSAAINVKGVEPANDTFTLRGLGGADIINFGTINGISGTRMLVDLEANPGAADPDGSADLVTIDFGDSADLVGLTDSAAGSVLTGAAAAITLAHAEPGIDTLRLNLQGGFDPATINQSGLAGGVRRVMIDGGDQRDTITIANTAVDGVVVILPSGGNDDLSVNTNGVGQSNVIFQGTQRIGTLSIGAGGRATLAASGGSVLTASVLSVTGTGRLDLTDNALILDYSSVNPIATVQSLLTSGFAGGAWNGSGINSSTAATTPGRTLGYSDITDLFTSFPANFAGQSVDNTAVVVRFTLPGDADLNQTVNIADFSRLASNFNVGATRWSRGNFDYNGITNIADFSLLSSNFNTGIPSEMPRLKFSDTLIELA